MKTKNLILFILISSFFLIFLVSIWKILATLQGLNIQNFNLQIIFIFGLLISFAHLRIGNKIKIFYKAIIFSLIFVKHLPYHLHYWKELEHDPLHFLTLQW